MRRAQNSKLEFTERKRTKRGSNVSNISQLGRLGCKMIWELKSTRLIMLRVKYLFFSCCLNAVWAFNGYKIMNVVIVCFPLISIFWSISGGNLQAVSNGHANTNYTDGRAQDLWGTPTAKFPLKCSDSAHPHDKPRGEVVNSVNWKQRHTKLTVI